MLSVGKNKAGIEPQISGVGSDCELKNYKIP